MNLTIFLWGNCSSFAGKATQVEMFGDYASGKYTVPLDQIHHNLMRFEEHACKVLSTGPQKNNNIAVGALTVFFGTQEETQAAKTFYFETTLESRKLLIFESTPGESQPEIKWGGTGLGFVDGHTMMVTQPSYLKTICFQKMQNFFDRTYASKTSG